MEFQTNNMSIKCLAEGLNVFYENNYPNRRLGHFVVNRFISNSTIAKVLKITRLELWFVPLGKSPEQVFIVQTTSRILTDEQQEREDYKITTLFTTQLLELLTSEKFKEYTNYEHTKTEQDTVIS